jgi:hypothetical protein
VCVQGRGRLGGRGEPLQALQARVGSARAHLAPCPDPTLPWPHLEAVDLHEAERHGGRQQLLHVAQLLDRPLHRRLDLAGWGRRGRVKRCACCKPWLQSSSTKGHTALRCWPAPRGPPRSAPGLRPWTPAPPPRPPHRAPGPAHTCGGGGQRWRRQTRPVSCVSAPAKLLRARPRHLHSSSHNQVATPMAAVISAHPCPCPLTSASTPGTPASARERAPAAPPARRAPPPPRARPGACTPACGAQAKRGVP